jgi:hypothetical protein
MLVLNTSAYLMMFIFSGLIVGNLLLLCHFWKLDLAGSLVLV